MGQRRGRAIEQRAAARREDHHLAVVAGEIADIHLLRDVVHCAIALVLQVRDGLIERGSLRDAYVEVLDFAEPIVDQVDAAGDVVIGLLAEILDLRGDGIELVGEEARFVHHLDAARSVLRLCRHGLEGVGQGADLGADRALRARRAEHVLHAGIERIQRIRLPEDGALLTQIRHQRLVHVAQDGADPYPGAADVEHDAFLVRDLAGIARRIHVRDVLRREVEQALVDLQPAQRIEKGDVEAHRRVSMLSETGGACRFAFVPARWPLRA